MHDLMSSIRKAAPGAANYDSDNDETMGKTPSKTPKGIKGITSQAIKTNQITSKQVL